jgi:hypothetical protein
MEAMNNMDTPTTISNGNEVTTPVEGRYPESLPKNGKLSNSLNMVGNEVTIEIGGLGKKLPSLE